MKYWPRQLSFWLALFAGGTLAAELTWLEIERRNESRLTLQWQQRLQQNEKLAQASPALSAQNEQAMSDEMLRLQREVAALRAELFPKIERGVGDANPDERINAYFDVAAMVARLRIAAAATAVVVKPDEHFGFSAYAHEAPAAADLARVRAQCLVGEALLNCLFSASPRELVAVKREPVDAGGSTTGNRQQPDHLVLERGLSLRSEGGLDAMTFRVEFTGETAALRKFLDALAHAAELLVVRSVEAAPASSGVSEKAGSQKGTNGLVTRQVILRFTVTVEAVRPAKTSVALTP